MIHSNMIALPIKVLSLLLCMRLKVTVALVATVYHTIVTFATKQDYAHLASGMTNAA